MSLRKSPALIVARLAAPPAQPRQGAARTPARTRSGTATMRGSCDVPCWPCARTPDRVYRELAEQLQPAKAFWNRQMEELAGLYRDLHREQRVGRAPISAAGDELQLS